MVVDIAGSTPKFVTSGGGDYGAIVDAHTSLMGDKMIQVKSRPNKWQGSKYNKRGYSIIDDDYI